VHSRAMLGNSWQIRPILLG